MSEPAIYAWEAVEEVLRELRVPNAAVRARQIIAGLEDRGWHVECDRD